MTFKEIYQKYNIMHILQEHMVRVAYVGKTLGENATEDIELNDIVKACLLHDMGNIIKFKLNVIENAVDDKGLEYWKNIKNEFITKYGNEEFLATKQICLELGASERVIELVNAFGTRNVKNIIETGDLNKMIVNYADHRVAPNGVVSLEDRILDQQNRFYKSFPSEVAHEKIQLRKETDEAKYELEKLIFEKSRLKPENILDIEIELLLPKYLVLEF